MGQRGTHGPRLVGRDRELAACREALNRRQGGGVLLVGEAGAGASSIARALIEELSDGNDREKLWVVASASEQSIPFGAFAPFVPEVGGRAGRQPDPFWLLQAIRRAVVSRAGGRRLVLGVDDAHRLDGQSATLLFQLISAEGALSVVTMRAGTRPPEAVTSLEKEGLLERVTVEPLDREHALELALAILENQTPSIRPEREQPISLSGHLGQALWRISRGNPLYIEELMSAAISAGRIVKVGNSWRLHGGLPLGLRLTELVNRRIEATTEEMAALELVAIADSLPLAVVTDLLPFEVTTSLVRRGLLRVEALQGEEQLVASHPLYSEVIRESMPALHRAQLCLRLADAFEQRGRSRSDLLRIVAWRLEAGEPPSVDTMMAACAQAAERHDWELSTRVAKAAVAAGGGTRAAYALGAALSSNGRYAEALEVVADRRGEGDEEIARLAVLRAFILAWGMGRFAEADSDLLTAEKEVRGEAERTWVAAVRAGLLNLSGRPSECVTRALPLLSRNGIGERATATVKAALATGLAWSGKCEDALEMAADGADPRLRNAGGALAITWSLMARYVAYRVSGRIPELEEMARQEHHVGLQLDNRHLIAAASSALGWAALARGHLEPAVAHFREAASVLESVDALGTRVQALCGVAEALAIGGDHAGADAALCEAERCEEGAGMMLMPRFSVAQAWVVAARGEVGRALADLADAAEYARFTGQVIFELHALSSALRLGATDLAGRLGQLERIVQGPMVRVLSAHASALGGDGDAGAELDEVAQGYADLSMFLSAAESAAQASRAHSAAGRPRRASVSAARAAALLRDMGGAVPITVSVAAVPAGLTRREREVAMLAVTGMSSQAIATRLSLSVRTVDSHLASVYYKLGIPGRRGLADALSLRPSDGPATHAS